MNYLAVVLDSDLTTPTLPFTARDRKCSAALSTSILISRPSNSGRSCLGRNSKHTASRISLNCTSSRCGNLAAVSSVLSVVPRTGSENSLAPIEFTARILSMQSRSGCRPLISMCLTGWSRVRSAMVKLKVALTFRMQVWLSPVSLNNCGI